MKKPPLFPKHWLPVYTFLLSIVFPLYSSAQVSEDDRKARCENNNKEIAKHEKRVDELKQLLDRIWEPDMIDHARTEMVLTKRILADVQRFPATKTSKTDTDKEDMKKKVEHLFLTDPIYTNGKYTINYYMNMDFDANGKLIKSNAFNTIRRIQVIRDSIIKKIDRNVALREKRPEIKSQLKEAEDKLSFHRNRSVELKCDDLAEKKDTKPEIIPEKKPELRPEIKPVAKPSSIDLSETTKYGTYTVNMKNINGDIYEGVYNNGVKVQFELRSDLLKDNIFSLQKLGRNTMKFEGRIVNNAVSGTIILGSPGTFTATLK